MGLLEQLSPSFLGLLAVFCVCGLVIQRIISSNSLPSAPGPKIAALTNLWYVWKVTQGRFEKWNIRQHAQWGKIVRVAPRMYSISDPASLQSIYGISSPMPKSSWYGAWGDPRVPDHNLFNTINRTAHAGMRRKVANFYSMTAISKYEPYVNNCTQILLSSFDRLAETHEKLDIQRWMQCYAFDVIGEITFGFRLGFLESGAQDVDGIMDGLERGNTFSTLMGIERLGAPFYFLYCGCGNPIRGLTTWVQKATQMRTEIMENEKYTNHDAADFYSKMQIAKEKDPEDFERYKMEGSLTTNVAAGSDTTSISLTAAIFYLATSPPVFNKLRSEIQNAENDSGVDDPITFEQAQKLPFLQAVIKEALRLWPATGLPMWRVVQKPGVTIAGKFFPPDSIVGVNSWVMHRHPDIFAPDPDVFRPERWLESGVQQLKDMERCFIPFGLGTRTCIGKNISILEMSKVIPQLVRRYKFEVLEQQMPYTNHWFVKQKNVYARIKTA